MLTITEIDCGRLCLEFSWVLFTAHVEYPWKSHSCYTHLNFCYLKDQITIGLEGCFRRNRKGLRKTVTKGMTKRVQFWKERGANRRVPQGFMLGWSDSYKRAARRSSGASPTYWLHSALPAASDKFKGWKGATGGSRASIQANMW